jgi:hypothetical protein
MSHEITSKLYNLISQVISVGSVLQIQVKFSKLEVFSLPAF